MAETAIYCRKCLETAPRRKVLLAKMSDCGMICVQHGNPEHKGFRQARFKNPEYSVIRCYECGHDQVVTTPVAQAV